MMAETSAEGRAEGRAEGANPTATVLLLLAFATPATAPPRARNGLGPHSTVEMAPDAFPSPTRATYFALEGAAPTRTALD